ncbi:MAG: GNAT family N-acetyltransferase [Candidatus Korobacteraceae bacterium]|jgi:amino-acid N-acetyltransferase
MQARRALLPDAEAIRSLIEEFSFDGTLLPRSLAEISENIRDFAVVEYSFSNGPEIIGCGALHLYGTHLAEIRSIAVRPSAQGLGAGRLLVNTLFEEADLHRVTCVCLFTRIPEFFDRMGFKIAERAKLPDKIYKDCMSCPRLLACDEIAMYRGELPQFAILEPAHADLIKLTL